MTPRNFFSDIVWRNVYDFGCAWDDTRLAFNAIAAIDSLAAHIYYWCLDNQPSKVTLYSDDIKFREALADREPEFRLLRDLAKLQKHAKLVRGHPAATEVTQIKRMNSGLAVEDMDGKVTTDAVCVDLGPGQSAPMLYFTVSCCLQFLHRLMDELEIPITNKQEAWEHQLYEP